MIKKIIPAMALVAAVMLPQAARADDYGCQVLLCLANPAGPMAVNECVPPITRLYREVFSWRPLPFPTCALSSGLDSSTGGNYAQIAPPSYYDNCPAGQTALPAGTLIDTGSSFVSGIGDGSGLSPVWNDGSYDPMPTKICVGNYLSTTMVNVGSGDSQTNYTVNNYSSVSYIPPSSTTFNINVYLNGSLAKNVRPNF